MRGSETVLLVAVGRLGRSVIEAGRHLGVGLPGHLLLAPGEPVPAGVRAPDGAIVVLDARVEADFEDAGGFWDSVAAAAAGGPAIALGVEGGRVGGPLEPRTAARAAGVTWIAIGHSAQVADAMALLVAGLSGDTVARLPERATAQFDRIDLRPARPREACAGLLAARCAQRLLADLSGPAEPAAQLAALSPAWAVLRGGAEAPPPGGPDSGHGFDFAGSAPALADSLADPIAPLAAAFAAGTVRIRDLAGAARKAVAGLADQQAAVPLTVLAADLDRAIAACVIAGGLANGRALVTALLAATCERTDADRAQGDGALASGLGGHRDCEESDDAALLEAALDDLERRAGSVALAVTFTRHAALLSGLRGVADAARRFWARRAVLPETAPIVALLESRWYRFDAVEDALAGLAGTVDADLPRGVRHEDYLGSLPEGEEAAIDALLREPGLGPALLSGDLVNFLQARAAARFFAWVPESLEPSPMDLAAIGPEGRTWEGEAVPALLVAGVPGSLPAGLAMELTRKVAAASLAEPIAVPIDPEGDLLIVRICDATRETWQDAGAPGRGAEQQPIVEEVGAPAVEEIGAPAAEEAFAPDADRPFPSEIFACSDDTFWAAFRGLLGRAKPAYDEPGLALEAARKEAPVLRMEALCRLQRDTAVDSDDAFRAAFRGLLGRTKPAYDEPGLALEAARGEAAAVRMEALCHLQRDGVLAEEEGWISRARNAARSNVLQPEREPRANLEAAIEYVHLWEDELYQFDIRHSALVEAETSLSWQFRSPRVPTRPLDDDHPAWYGAAAAEPLDPIAQTAELVAIGLATHLISHVEGYLAFTYAEDNGLIHTAILAPADDPVGTIAGLLANPEALPVLRRDAGERLADPRFHDAIRTYVHDLGAEVATRDWLRMPVNAHQRLLADRGLAIMRSLPQRPGQDFDGAIEAPAADVAWDAGMVLPGLPGYRHGGQTDGALATEGPG